MVELTGPDQPVQKNINNAVFIIPAILFAAFAIFCVRKIYYILNEPRSSKVKKQKAAKRKLKYEILVLFNMRTLPVVSCDFLMKFMT
ncbi:hypothetical protein TSMEX_006394 [Taenia solium]|eukprot:TsM_000449800 transcript=TsM_000449800 gene=TsM_000449800